MTTQQLLLTAWEWKPFVLGGCLAALLLYAALGKHWKSIKISYLLGGLAVCLLALVSPISVLADGYLFSAHMLQHMLLLLIAPPLLLLSLPLGQPSTPSSHPLWDRVERVLTYPLLTWLAGVGAMWLWHVPTLCNAATSSQPIHGLQVFTLLVMGGLFWWPICGPLANRRLPVLNAVLYLFSACVGCTLLGIWITFSPVEVCSIFMHPADKLGILPLIQHDWKLTPALDQQIGGLLMWVPACLIYLSIIMGMLLKWFAAKDGRVVVNSEATRLSSNNLEPADHKSYSPTEKNPSQKGTVQSGSTPLPERKLP
jgi:putative membrane protein